jgi:hypothetical protein
VYQQAAATIVGMNLKGKRIAVLLDNLYQEMEVWYPTSG